MRPWAKQRDLLACLLIHDCWLLSARLASGREESTARCYGGSAPVLCWSRSSLFDVRIPAGWNPSGRGKTWRCGAPISRNATKARSDARMLRTSTNRAFVPRRSGNSVSRISRLSRTPCRRRRTQRTAPATSISGRSFFAAASTLRDSSTFTTTCSASSRLPVSRALMQSGSKLNVRWASPAVPTRHFHPRRLNPRVGAMAGKTTATTRVTWAPFQTCVKPASFANVLLAGEHCMLTKLHRPRARTLGTWRAHLLFPASDARDRTLLITDLITYRQPLLIPPFATFSGISPRA